MRLNLHQDSGYGKISRGQGVTSRVFAYFSSHRRFVSVILWCLTFTEIHDDTPGMQSGRRSSKKVAILALYEKSFGYICIKLIKSIDPTMICPILD